MENIVFITLAAVIAGAQTWNEVEQFGNDKRKWFEKHLKLENGIPSHDTFNRFFSSIDHEVFEDVFRQWVDTIIEDLKDDIVAIDGKTIVGASRRGSKVHVVSAWSNRNSISLGQLKTDDKSNEIKAIPKLLDALSIEGAIVTIDAIGTQPTIAKKIVERKADYILQVKKNRKWLMRDIEYAFNTYAADSTKTVTDIGHGKIETRIGQMSSDLTGLRSIENWAGVRSIVRIQSEVIYKSTGLVEKTTRHYITSLDLPAGEIMKMTKAHWGVENNLHWMLDVNFREDADRKHNKNAVMNWSAINKIVLHILQKDKTVKLGIRSKRFKAASNEDYLSMLIFG